MTPRDAQNATLRFAGWRLEPGARRLVGPDGREAELTGGEFNLLLAFAERPGRVLSREQLWISPAAEATPFDRSVDSQISRLRRKIEPIPAGPR